MIPGSTIHPDVVVTSSRELAKYDNVWYGPKFRYGDFKNYSYIATVVKDDVISMILLRSVLDGAVPCRVAGPAGMFLSRFVTVTEF